MIAAVLCSAALFLFVYHADNKYTAGGPRGENGVLVVSEQDLSENPCFFLTWGWEIYRGKLLGPDDFISGNLVPDEHVFIGQYGGFEGRRGSGRGPHGSATYRLNIIIPDEPRTYMLELPEIFSAYRLYVNGGLLAEMGSLDPYLPQTGNQILALHGGADGSSGSGQFEIIIAVSDFSNFYSGMVYPPAFGEFSAVNHILNTRLGVRFTAIALSLGVGLFYFAIWLLLRKGNGKTENNALPLCFAAICLCFTLYICYPVVTTLIATGPLWYGLERFSFPAMLLIITIIHCRITGVARIPSTMAVGFGVFVCLCAAVMPLTMGSSLRLMMAYSYLLTVYKWALAAFLVGSAVFACVKGFSYSNIMLAIGGVFGTSLAVDRLLPFFEPIRFGWFSEISAGVFVLAIGAVMAKDVAAQFRLRQQLQGHVESVTRIMDVHKVFYPEVLEKEEELRVERHDFRHHIAVMRELLQSGDMSKLAEYLRAFDVRAMRSEKTVYCDHYFINMILRMFKGLAGKSGVAFSVEASLPDSLPFEDVDLSVIMNNVLENALEASERVPAHERRITVSIRCKMNCLGFSVGNAFDGAVKMHSGRFMSSKQNGGIGLVSVQRVCARYGGSASFYVEDNIFRSDILLPLNRRKGAG